MVDLTSINEILKIDYIEVVRDVLNSSTVLNHRLEKDYESVQGDRVYIALNTNRNHSFASAADGSAPNTSVTLPQAGSQSYAATTFQIPEMYGRLQVTERMIKASRNSKGALIRVLDTEMRHLIRDSKNAINKMNFGDGSGAFARVNQADPDTSATGVIIVDAEHTGDAGGTAATAFGGRLLEAGQRVNFYAAKTSGTAAEMTGGDYFIIATTDTTITVSATAGGAAEDLTSPTNANTATEIDDDNWIANTGSIGNDQMGLLGIVDDGDATYGFLSTYNGIDRATAGNEFWQANVNRNAGVLRDVTLNMYQEAIDTSEIQGDGEITAFLTTYGLRRETLGLLVADKRFVAPYEMDLDGGFRALSYNGIPIIPDRHAPLHKIFGLDEPTIRFYQMSDWEWMEEDGAVLNRVPDRASYEATLFLYREMACTDPRNSVKIDDLNDPT